MSFCLFLRSFLSPFVTFTIAEDRSDVSGQYLKRRALDLINCPAETDKADVILYHNGRIVHDADSIDIEEHNGTTVDICPRILGGKGGFGSMLRALGAQINRTTNKEACRDLSGRRMRDVNAQKTMASWAEKEAEREREKAERKKEKMEKILRGPRHHFDDANYTNQIQENAEKMQDAVIKGLKRPAASGDAAAASSLSKKPKGWLGMDEFEEDSSGDDDIDREDIKTLNPDVEGEATSQQTDALESVKEEVGEAVATSETKDDKEEEEKGKAASNPKKKNKRKRGETKDIEAVSLDLSDIAGVEQLETMGRDRLKSALVALGLKCGGTLEQLAARLFATKNVSLDSLDSSLFAKPRNK